MKDSDFLEAVAKCAKVLNSKSSRECLVDVGVLKINSRSLGPRAVAIPSQATRETKVSDTTRGNEQFSML